MKNKSRTIRKTVFALSAVVIILLTVIFGNLIVSYLGKPDGFRRWISEKGLLGKTVFVISVVFQVVFALIPGEPFELCAGFAFGTVWGAILFFTGAAIGSAIVFLISRKYGRKALSFFFSEKKIDSLSFLESNKQNNTLFFLIFLLPGTPKDLLSYYAGLTGLSFGKWMLISSVGRIPSVLSSVIGGNSLGEGNYSVSVIVFTVTAVLSISGLLIYRAVGKKNNTKQ